MGRGDQLAGDGKEAEDACYASRVVTERAQVEPGVGIMSVAAIHFLRYQDLVPARSKGEHRKVLTRYSKRFWGRRWVGGRRKEPYRRVRGFLSKLSSLKDTIVVDSYKINIL